MNYRASLYHLGRFATHKGQDALEKKETKEELHDVVATAHQPLYKATTVFPFTMFPDTVTIDRSKLTITHRVFFAVADVISIKIEDILNVIPHVGPFFGSIDVHTRYFDPHKPYKVTYLWRGDALKIERIMQGYSIAMAKDIDCSALGNKELATMLDRLGQGASELIN
jgi:hypothetical protein